MKYIKSRSSNVFFSAMLTLCISVLSPIILSAVGDLNNIDNKNNHNNNNNNNNKNNFKLVPMNLSNNQKRMQKKIDNNVGSFNRFRIYGVPKNKNEVNVKNITYKNKNFEVNNFKIYEFNSKTDKGTFSKNSKINKNNKNKIEYDFLSEDLEKLEKEIYEKEYNSNRPEWKLPKILLNSKIDSK